MTGATFHRHLFLGVVKYSKLCESLTILAPVHLRGFRLTGGFQSENVTINWPHFSRSICLEKTLLRILVWKFDHWKLNKINRNDITRSSGTPSGLNIISQDQKVCRRNVCRRNVLSAKRPHPTLCMYEYQPKGGDVLWLGSKGKYGLCVGGR